MCWIEASRLINQTSLNCCVVWWLVNRNIHLLCLILLDTVTSDRCINIPGYHAGLIVTIICTYYLLNIFPFANNKTVYDC